MKHIVLAVTVLLLALVLCLLGFASGAMAVMVLGFALEAGVWLGLFQARRNRSLH